ncbi:hypothetical protein ACFCWY_09145 [Streptomyces sp. NPDC056362]|uniref:hypothetical protein n=1 Tax=unclassified Streptomyces TaxID=2593676 RepID=UPI0035E3A170
MTPEILARIATARAQRDLSDLARQLLASTSETLSPAERITNARRLRQMAVQIVDLVVVGEALSGASWEEIGSALRPHDPGSVREEYEDAVEQWAALPEEELEHQAAGFEALDDWYARHREDQDPELRTPVSDLLNRH